MSTKGENADFKSGARESGLGRGAHDLDRSLVAGPALNLKPGLMHQHSQSVNGLSTTLVRGPKDGRLERVIDEVFTRPYTTASGEVIQVTKEQIDALRKNTVILDETGEAIGLLNVYAPALAVAQENLKNEVAKFSLERLKDITPEEFEQAKREGRLL